MTDQNMENDATEASTENTQSEAEVKTFTQEEVSAIAARAAAKEAKKYEGVDVDKFHQYEADAEKQARKEQIKKGEFEKIMEEQASKFKARESELQQKITEYNINSPILNAAAKHRAVDPAQVQALIKGDFRLSDTGDVEVLDKEGKPRYNDDGKPFTVDERVSEFLDSNAHFVQATPSTTNTQTNHNANVQGEFIVDPSKMKDPEYRKKYAEHRKKNGIA